MSQYFLRGAVSTGAKLPVRQRRSLVNFGGACGLAGLLIVFLFACGTPRASAQNVYAAIHGTVSDPSGAVVPNTRVTTLNLSTGISSVQTTDSKGYYVFPQLAIGGPYKVTIEAPGFKTQAVTGFRLQSNENREVNATLQPGAVSETVQVSATAVQVDTSDTQMKATVGSQQIEQMPLLGRDASMLQKLTPGSVESSDRFGNFSANGNQTQENSYLLDGADINDGPLQTQGIIVNPDALAEVAVLTSTQNPEYSRNSGAFVNEQLKSGTNQFHGDGFEFYRDTFLNNGNYFSTTRPPFHQNLFGGTLGGPVLKNKLFFFVAYQGFRNRTGTTQLTPVPTDATLGRNATGIANLSGDTNIANETSSGSTNAQVGLSSNPLPFAITTTTGTCAKGTPWNQCFPTGSVMLPTSTFNPIAAHLIAKYLPSPNYAQGGVTDYNFNALNSAKADQGVIRVDAHVTSRDLLWASSIFQSNPNFNTLPFTGATVPGFAQNNARHIKIFNASWTHTFNATTLNELRAGYYRFNYAAVEPAQIVQPSSLGFSINPQDAAAASVPLISLQGLFTLGFSNNGPQPRIDTNGDYSDNFTKIAGNHNMMFGAHVERFVVHNPFYSNLNGNFTFDGSGSFTSGDPLLDFLLGIPSGFSQGSGAMINASAWEIYGYAQDNWRVSSSVTLNYGIGYDIQTPFANLQYGGKAVICFQPGVQSKVFPTAQPGLTYPGDAGCNDQGGATAKYDHFAPRMGLDWSPSQGMGWLTGPAGQHLMAVRGGFGVYFNRDSEEAQLQNLEDPPFGTSSTGAADVTMTGPGGTTLAGSPSFADPYQDVASRPGLSEANKFPYAFPTPGQTINFSQFVPYDLSGISPSYNVPYALSFNLNVQRQLPGEQVLQVAYVGTLGRRLVRAYEADRMTAAGHANAVAACQTMSTSGCLKLASLLSLYQPQDFRDTSGNFLSVGHVYTNGSSNYNALQVSLQRQTNRGLYYTIGYTWSHALDNGSSFESSGFGNSYDLTGTNWVPGFQQLTYGNSEYDARQRFYAGYGYVVPLTAGMRQNYLVNEALGGWHFVGYTVLQSGNPASIGETGTNRSLWGNSIFAFYELPDTPNTSNFHPAIKSPRRTGNYWFDTTPFSPEPLGTFGNVKRNFLRGPGFNYTDLSMFKDLPLGHADSPRYVELRLESFNLFNHANFGPPDGNLSDGPVFGQISSVIQPATDGGAGDPQPGRAVQLGAKIYF